MAFSPTVTWNAAFNATPAGSDDPRQGDDRIRELKTALDERLARELFWGLTGGSSAGQEGNLRAGAGRVYHQSSAPTVKPDGNTLDADDVGRMYAQSNTTPLYVRTSNNTWVRVVAGGVSGSDGNIVLPKVINIGDWNMTGVSKSVAHGLTLSKIIRVSVMVRNDADTLRTKDGVDPVATGNLGLFIKSVDATNVNLGVETGTAYVTGGNYVTTSYNRGWIFIDYLP